MKEFVEKLIERLEEYIEEYSETDKNGLHSERWCAMQEAKMVVNQLAEEYTHSKSKSLEKQPEEPQTNFYAERFNKVL